MEGEHNPINRNLSFCLKKSDILGNNSILNEQTVPVKQDQQKENEKFGNNKTMLEETPNSVSMPSAVKTSTSNMYNGDSKILKRNTTKSYKTAEERIPSFYFISKPVCSAKKVKNHSNNPNKSTNMVNRDSKKLNHKMANVFKKTEERIPSFLSIPSPSYNEILRC
ncbi:uncharacterized protein LOC126904492 [Daktulosphaira vitifoliae]|uniref:uncharacterized protein LOC126904492 n=1 Tax=Daktulosphaira vitifoliae TaxID=58002 RepID=UPI0021AABD35|nr:uncharacterized protein LOC126904492 [Daktulosphaira vitifoliae]